MTVLRSIVKPIVSVHVQAAVDVELHGVTIPAGAVVNLRYAAANRDERQFECPAELDLERHKPQRHLSFGVGLHHCLGAPLARREMYYGFKAFVDRIDELWFIEGDEFVSAGLMPDDPDQTVVLDGSAGAAAAVGITVEPDGGSEQPTNDPIAVFDLTEAT